MSSATGAAASVTGAANEARPNVWLGRDNTQKPSGGGGIIVCQACRRASCANGMIMCQAGPGARLVTMSVHDLTRMGLESHDYWTPRGLREYAAIFGGVPPGFGRRHKPPVGVPAS